METVTDFIFLGSKITLTVTAAMKLKDVWSWKESYDKSRQCVKKQRLHFAYKGPYSQSYGFSSSHVWMWELDHKKGLVLNNWETLERPLDFKDIKPVNTKGNQPWILTRMTDAEAEAPVLWPLDAKSQLIGKDLDAGKDWRQKKGTAEGETVGWHHWPSGMNISKLRRQWWIEEPGVLQAIQRVRHDLATEQHQQNKCVVVNIGFNVSFVDDNIKHILICLSALCISSLISCLFRTLCPTVCFLIRASLVAQMVKNLPAMQETQVWSLGWEDLYLSFMCSLHILDISPLSDMCYANFCPFFDFFKSWSIVDLQCISFRYTAQWFETHTHTHTHTLYLLYPFLCQWTFRLLPLRNFFYRAEVFHFNKG